MATTLAMFVSSPGNQIVIPVAEIENNKTSFEKFLNKFPEANLPYAVDMEALAIDQLDPEDAPDLDEASLLGDEFGTILPAIEHRKFSRMGPDDFHAEAILASTDDFHILTYSRKHPFSFYTGSHVLAVFSRSGKLLDELSFAYSYGRDGGMTGSIDQSFTIEISEKETIWSKDVDKFGYEDNKVERYKTVSSKFYTIDKDGKFEEMNINRVKPEAVVVEDNAD